jgi:hypothetical protein
MNADRWSEDAVAKLRELAAQGLTAREIADALGEGFTRNAVIGKTQRMGIWLGRSRKTPTEPEEIVEPVVQLFQQKMPRRAAKFSFPHEDDPAPPVTTGTQVTLMGLKNFMCRYPVDGEGARTIFCGAATQTGSWCDAHRAAVFVPRVGVKRDGEKVELRTKATRLLSHTGLGSVDFTRKPRAF